MISDQEVKSLYKPVLNKYVVLSAVESHYSEF